MFYAEIVADKSLGQKKESTETSRSRKRRKHPTSQLLVRSSPEERMYDCKLRIPPSSLYGPGIRLAGTPTKIRGSNLTTKHGAVTAARSKRPNHVINAKTQTQYQFADHRIQETVRNSLSKFSSVQNSYSSPRGTVLRHICSDSRWTRSQFSSV